MPADPLSCHVQLCGWNPELVGNDL